MTRRGADITSRLARAHERLGPRYLVAWELAQATFLVAAASAGALTASQFVSMDGPERARAVVLAALLTALSSLAGARAVARTRRPLLAWYAAGRPGGTAAVAAWRVVVAMPLRDMAVHAAAAALLAALPWTVLVAFDLGLGLRSAVLMYASTLAVGSYLAMIAGAVVERVYVPIRAAVASVVPPDAREDVGSLRTRLIVTLLVGLAGAGGVTALALTAVDGGSLDALGARALAAALIATTLTLVPVVLVARSVVVPVRELLDAIERARRGEPARPVPAVTADEFADLARTLDGAIEALEERTRLRERTARLQAQAAAEERELRAGEDAAAQAVRMGVARDLHDVIAHCMTVVVLQAGALAGEDGDAGGRRLDAIAASNEQAATELRRLVTVLGAGGSVAGEPDPAGDLRAIADTVRAAGLDVRLDDRAGSAAPPAAVRAAVRIAQEALTNVLKHSRAETVDVALRRAGDRLELEVRDDGPPRAGSQAGSTGEGLRNMASRAAALGGAVEAGPRRPGPGYAVRAWLPLDAAG